MHNDTHVFLFIGINVYVKKRFSSSLVIEWCVCVLVYYTQISRAGHTIKKNVRARWTEIVDARVDDRATGTTIWWDDDDDDARS